MCLDARLRGHDRKNSPAAQIVGSDLNLSDYLNGELFSCSTISLEAISKKKIAAAARFKPEEYFRISRI
jgi:hypothetical protein